MQHLPLSFGCGLLPVRPEPPVGQQRFPMETSLCKIPSAVKFNAGHLWDSRDAPSPPRRSGLFQMRSGGSDVREIPRVLPRRLHQDPHLCAPRPCVCTPQASPAPCLPSEEPSPRTQPVGTPHGVPRRERSLLAGLRRRGQAPTAERRAPGAEAALPGHLEEPARSRRGRAGLGQASKCLRFVPCVNNCVWLVDYVVLFPTLPPPGTYCVKGTEWRKPGSFWRVVSRMGNPRGREDYPGPEPLVPPGFQEGIVPWAQVLPGRRFIRWESCWIWCETVFPA